MNKRDLIMSFMAVVGTLLAIQAFNILDKAETNKIKQVVDRRFKSTDFQYFITHARVREDKTLCVDSGDLKAFYAKEDLKPTPFYKMVIDKNSTITCER